mgnify:CR=1 FL=1
MFCPNCGAKVFEGSTKCSQCGEVFAAIGTKTGEGAFKGFLILLVSYFTMPLKTLKITLQQLRSLGMKGSLEVKNTEIPHLTWIGIAGHFVASFVIILIILGSVIAGLKSLEKLKYSAVDAFVGLIGYPIGGILVAIFADWFIMVGLEILLLWVSITNDIKKIADKN